MGIIGNRNLPARWLRRFNFRIPTFHASIYFEDINALLPGEQEYLAFEDKERRFTEQLVRYIGQEALPDEARPVVVSELRPIIRAYGQLLAPQYWLDPLLAETFGWDEPIYGLLDRLFQENIHSVYLFSFEQEDFSQLEPEAAAHLSLFSSPADYYHKPALRSVADTLVSKGVRLYLMQPLNFLTFLEWRQERELSVQPFVVELYLPPYCFSV